MIIDCLKTYFHLIRICVITLYVCYMTIDKILPYIKQDVEASFAITITFIFGHKLWWM